MIQGSIDELDRSRVRGWARDMAHPNAPVTLLVSAQGRLLGRVVANTVRADLVAADIGDGRFAFDVTFYPPLSPARSWLIHVRAEGSGDHLPGSPVRLPASNEFNTAARHALSAMLDGFASDADLDDRIGFLATERDRMLQRRANRKRGPSQPGPARRALVVDHQVPAPDHDGGSSAIMSHMRSLQRLGYQVSFAAPAMDGNATVLEQAGIICCQRPWYATVEEVLRREADGFDVVYLHRVSVASAYATLVRQSQPRAHLVYSVADLHHLRLMRQAEYEDRPELLPEAERLRAHELWCGRVADAVVTHSTAEADLLRPVLGAGKVHVVAWSMPLRPSRRTFGERSGAVLLGHFAHPPNVAAAWVLRDEILPLLQREDPSIRCMLVGDALPPGLQAPCPGLEHAGHAASLDDLFDRVRLTVAPLPFGAGVKGKVLASLTAGVPCVCSPIAAEGIGLPPRLQDLVVHDAAEAVRLIVRLHNDEPYHARLAKRCLAFANRAFSDQALDTALQHAVGGSRTGERRRGGEGE